MANFTRYNAGRKRFVFKPHCGTPLGCYRVRIELTNTQTQLSTNYSMAVEVQANGAAKQCVDQEQDKLFIVVDEKSLADEDGHPSGEQTPGNSSEGQNASSAVVVDVPQDTRVFPVGKIRSISPDGLIRVGIRYQDGTTDAQKFLDEDYIHFKIVPNPPLDKSVLSWDFISGTLDKSLFTFQLNFDLTQTMKKDWVRNSQIMLCFTPFPTKI